MLGRPKEYSEHSKHAKGKRYDSGRINIQNTELNSVNLLPLKLAFEVKAVYSLRAALYIVKLLMLLHKLSTAAA
jgi:hypothetical protein